MKLRNNGTGAVQIGTLADKDATGAFFAQMSAGETINIPDSLAAEIKQSRDAWLEKHLELID
jgi:hypothetical protein